MVWLKFIFYTLYLFAAELPIFLILFLRSWDEDNIHLIFKILTFISIVLNLLLCLFLLFHRKNSLMRNQISEIKSNNAQISDFFSFFLLPFFTFSFAQNMDSGRFFIELGILFTLLSILLFKTKNLSSNIIFYLIFNLYDVKTDSKNNIRFLVLNGLNIEDFKEGLTHTIKITETTYIYYGTKKKLIYNLIITISLLLVILFFVLYSSKFL